MTPPTKTQNSPTSAVPRREDEGLLRILVVPGEGAGSATLLQNLRQWAEDGRLRLETAPDLPRAVRQLAASTWDVVLAVLGERPDEDLSWWVDTLRAAAGGPRLIAAAQAPSMGLVLRAEQSGVLDVLSLPVRRDELMQALGRLRAVASEAAIPLPVVEPEVVGPYALVGQSPAMLDVYKQLARVAGSATTRKPSSRGDSARTSTIGSPSSRSASPSSRIAGTISSCSPRTSSRCTRSATARRSMPSPTGRWICCAAMPGSATCASCATSSSGP